MRLASQFHNYTASLAPGSFLWLMLLEKLANVEKSTVMCSQVSELWRPEENVHIVSKGFNQKEYEKDERAFTINIIKPPLKSVFFCLLYSLTFSMKKATPPLFQGNKHIYWKSLQRIISQQHYKVSTKQFSVVENYCLYYWRQSCTEAICLQWCVSIFPVRLWHGPIPEKR